MQKLLQVTNGQATVSTLTVAEYTKVQHHTITRIIRDNTSDFMEFGKVGFEIQPIKNSKNKINEVRYYNLNEQQYSLLMTYLRNTPVVKEFKKNMVKAFFIMRDRIKHDGKSSQHLISGLKSGMAKKDKKIKFLENKLLALPSPKSLDNKISVLHQMVDESLKNDNASWGYREQWAKTLSLYIQHIKLNGTEQQKFMLEEIEKQNKKIKEYSDAKIKAEHQRDLLKKKIDQFIVASNEMLRVRYQDKK